ncbi:MAG: hypothetical protein QW255_05295 [Candidatus Bilamarchaeaceae archaeon]
MRKKYINMEDNTISVSVWQTLRKDIIEFSKMRREKLGNTSDINIEELIRKYKELPELSEERRNIEEIILLYNFPMILIIVKKGAILMKNDNYIKDLFNHLLLVTIDTIRRYKIDAENKFSTYLASCLRGETIKFIDNTRVVKYNYYYITQKKGQEPINILLESDLNNMFDSDESELVSMYSHHYLKDNFHQDIEYDISLDRVNKMLEYMKDFLKNKYDAPENTKAFLHEYMFSHKTAREVSVRILSNKYNMGIKECYSEIKKFQKEFRKYCESDKGELGSLYASLLENL